MRKPSRLIVAALAVVSTAPSALAVVNTITGTGTAQVQEFQGASVVNSDYAFKDFDTTTTSLPLLVNTMLSRGEAGSETAGGSASTLLSDPRLSDQPDPDEFAMDVAAFSTLSDISYSCTSGATEDRGIVFTSSEIGASDGTALLASSQFFLDGIMLIWGEQEQTDLSGTTVSVNLGVNQTRDGAETPTTVLTASLTVVGQADGTIGVSTSGSLEAANVTVMDLTGSVSGFGPIHMVIIPSLAIPYQYEATVGESFVLQGQLGAAVRNRPGTGASVSLGQPVLEMAGLINSLTGDTTGDILVQLITSALGSAPAPAKPLVASQAGTTVTVKRSGISLFELPQCGALGVEAAAIPIAMTALTCFRRRR